jgi:hypothetical protein
LIVPTRYAHTAVAANFWSTMLVFGGYDEKHDLTNHLYEFNIETLGWTTNTRGTLSQVNGVGLEEEGVYTITDTNIHYKECFQQLLQKVR